MRARLILLFLVLAGYGLAYALPRPVPTPVALQIGVGGPMTGPDAVFGQQLRNGVDQALEDMNVKGGILGKKLKLAIGDDAADPKQGVSVANRFVSDGIKFVIGHFNSSVTMPATDIYDENGILDITPASTNPMITDRGFETIFRTCGRDDQQAIVAANYLATLPNQKIAFLHDKTTYGKGLADETRKDLLALGISDVLYEGVNKGERDYSAVVSKLKAAGATIVYWGGYHTEAGLLVRQMRDQGVTATLMAGDGIASDEYAAIGGPGIEGTLMTFPPDPRNRPEAAEVVARYRAKNINPETYTLYTYAAVEVIKQAAETVGTLDPVEVARMIHSGMLFKTVIGDISYDKKGDVTRADYTIFVWRKGPDGKLSYYELNKQS